jgi:hypothetical protein
VISFNKALTIAALSGVLTVGINSTVNFNNADNYAQKNNFQLELGQKANAFNFCPDNNRNVTDEDGYYIDSRTNTCGRIYIRMNPKAANYLSWRVKIARNTAAFAGLGGFIGNLNPVFSSLTSFGAYKLSNATDTLDFCSNNGQNSMLETTSWSAFTWVEAHCE